MGKGKGLEPTEALTHLISRYPDDCAIQFYNERGAYTLFGRALGLGRNVKPDFLAVLSVEWSAE